MVRGGDGGDGGGGEACGVRVGGRAVRQYVAAVFVLVVVQCWGSDKVRVRYSCTSKQERIIISYWPSQLGKVAGWPAGRSASLMFGRSIL